MKEHITLVRKIGLVGITNFLTGLGSLILIPILTKNFTVQEYGIWVQIIATIGLVPYLSTLGLSDSMIRFLAVLNDKSKIREGFYSIFFIAVISTFIVSMLLFIFFCTIAKGLFNNYIVISMILPFIIFISSLYFVLLNYFRTFQQMRAYSLFLFLQSYILIALVAYFAISGYSLFFAVIGLLISYIIMFFIMFSFILSNIGFKIPRFSNIKEYLSFSLPNIPSNLSYWIVDSSDRYLIAILLGTSYVGYYSPSYALGSVITMFSSPLYILLFPVLSNYYDNNEISKVKLILKYSLKYFLALAIPSVFILSILSKQILMALTTSEIAINGYLITPFVALSTLFIGVYIIFSQIVILEKRTKIIGSIWIFAATLNFILNLMIIPFLGILGAAFVTLISYASSFVLLLFYSKRYISFDADLPFIGKSIAASILTSMIIFVFYPATIIETVIMVGIGFTVYVISIILLKGITKDEITFLKNLISNKI